MVNSRYAFLQHIPLFRDLPEAELNFLLDRAVVMHFKPGQMIFDEGDPCEGLYVTESGQVKIFRTSPGGRGVALRPVWGERGVAAVGGAVAQCADGAEAAGPAAGVAVGAPEAAAVFDFQHAGAPRASCADGDVTPGHQPEAVGGMDRRLEAAARGDLMRPDEESLIDGFVSYFWAQLFSSFWRMKGSPMPRTPG
ncbi:MAG: Crp/Fnr family transcriptional regulator [Terriglobia bacterium]